MRYRGSHIEWLYKQASKVGELYRFSQLNEKCEDVAKQKIRGGENKVKKVSEKT
jgi:hypothetical protein